MKHFGVLHWQQLHAPAPAPASNCIEACHRVCKKSATVIATSSRRKDCQQVLAVKKHLRKIKMENADLPGQNKLFMNKNLCPYYKVIRSKCKKLHSLGKINKFLLLGDTIKIKVSENILYLSIADVHDFGKYFPDIDLSPPKRNCFLSYLNLALNSYICF